MWSWGRSDFGQLGRETNDQKVSFSGGATSQSQTFDPLPQKIKFAATRIVVIAAGGEHNLAVDVDGRLWSWGWNEHGMCGVLESSSGHAVEPLSVSDTRWCLRRPEQVPFALFEHQGRVSCIGAGYGHSFAFLSFI